MDSEWFERLISALDASGKSYRKVSIEAGFGHNYVTQMVKEKALPSVDKFLAICDVIGSDPIEILTGLEQGENTYKILTLLGSLGPQQRNVFVSMLESFQSAISDEQESNSVGEEVQAPQPEPDNKFFLTDETGQLDAEMLQEASNLVRQQELDLTDEALFNMEEYDRRLKKEYNQLYLARLSDSTGQKQSSA